MKSNSVYCHLLFLLLFAVIFNQTTSSQPLGNGSEGSPSISGIVNAYTPLMESTFQCSQRISVGDASLFNIGDLILIIQMQGAEIDASNTSSYGSILDYHNAGNYEYSKVKSKNGNTLELQFPLLRSYDTIGKVQVIRIPQYDSPVVIGTLTCQPWNGSMGGVLAIDAIGTINLQAGMNVSAMGFRGGQVISGPDYITDTSYVSETPSLTANGTKGEGIAFYGIAPFTSAKGPPANGGGGGNSHTGGGAGGANAGCGGNGGWGYPVNSDYRLAQGLGGHQLTYSSAQNKIFMGGGGGSGSIHANQGSPGGNGGGIILITVNQMTGHFNNINAFGDSTLSGGSPTHADGIGGAGAGGTVLLTLNGISDTVNVNVYGGNGGDPSLQGAGPGGGGGGGMCWTNAAILTTSVSINNAGGIGGSIVGNNYGAAIGCPGSSLNNLVVPVNNFMPAVQAAFSVTLSNQLGTEIVFTNNSSNANSYHWNFGDGDTDIVSDPEHSYSSPGIYPVTLIASDLLGCKDTSIETVITNMVNVFTPNGDYKNDFFAFPNFNTENYSIHFLIYDRWGIKVFEGNDGKNTWDGTVNGKKASEGTYYYVLEITDKIKGEKIVKKDSLTLIRSNN